MIHKWEGKYWREQTGSPLPWDLLASCGNCYLVRQNGDHWETLQLGLGN